MASEPSLSRIPEPSGNIATVPIQLRHDTLANFISVMPNLYNGEVFVDSQTGSVRIGCDWSSSLYDDFLPPIGQGVIFRDIPFAQSVNRFLSYDSYMSDGTRTLMDDIVSRAPVAVTLGANNSVFPLELPVVDGTPWGIATNFRSVSDLSECYVDVVFSGLVRLTSPDDDFYYDYKYNYLAGSCCYTLPGEGGKIYYMPSFPTEEDFFPVGMYFNNSIVLGASNVITENLIQ